MSAAKIFVTETQRGQPCLVIEGRRFKQRKGRAGWQCCSNSCNAKVFVSEDNERVLRMEGDHKCKLVEDARVQRNLLIASVKRKARDNQDAPPSKIVCRELRRNNDNYELLTVRDTHRAAQCIGYARRQEHGMLGTSAAHTLQILRETQDSVLTCRRERFCFVKNDLALFTCKQNLTLLSECDLYLIDGTFNFAPKHFVQLYSVHGLKGGHYVPLAFIPLENKSAVMYEKMWSTLCGLANEEAQVTLRPRTVLVDFEDGAHSAVQCTFPECTVQGCRFHLHQNFTKHIRSNAVTRDAFAETESENGKWLHVFFGLSLLPPSLVVDGFLTLMEYAPNPPEFHVFADYVLEYYVSENAKYQPDLWARAPAFDDPRTTNAVEGFHRGYNDKFHGAHPNIHVFIDILLDYQASSYIKINSIKNNIPGRVRNDVQERVRKAVDAWGQFSRGERTMFSYLKYMGFLVKKKA